MKTLLLLLAFLFSFCSHSSAQPAGHPPADNISREKDPFRILDITAAQSVSSSNFDVHFYRCEWDVDPANRYIAGKVSPHFTITEATSSITLDLSNALTVDSVLYHGLLINFQQSANHALQITFPATLAPGLKDSFSIFYKGIPSNSGFGSFTTRTHQGTPVLWTLSEPYGAREWWPCKDVLTDKADSIDIVITYPAAYQSSSNGLLRSEAVMGGIKRDHWKHRYPIAAYLVAIAVTNYSIDRDSVQLPSGNMPVEMYAYPEDAAAFKAATATAKACLQTFSELVGNYPFSNERYAQTQFGWGGGMEHQTNSFITVPNEGLVAHELAHQWFGNKVTTGSWQDLWLNEGFATYMELVYAEFVKRSGAINLLQDWHKNITAAPGGSVFITDTSNIGRLFNSRLTYQKGGYVLHMLRWKLGDSAFFRGLRHYLSDPVVRYKTARTADLQRNMEMAGGQPLTEFFKDWIYGEGHPAYKGEWGLIQPDMVYLTLSQTASHASVPFFEMPVPLQFKNATRDTILTVNHTRNGEVFTLNPGFMPDTVLIDPQLWILSKGNLATKTAVITDIPDLPGTATVIAFPNPATNRITLKLPAGFAQKTGIRLINVLGQDVFSKTYTAIADKQVTIPVYHLTPGIYWIQVTRNGSQTAMKMMVVKR